MNKLDSERYAARGVSSSKEEVHAAIKNEDKGLFPKAFCKIIPDPADPEGEDCFLMHADGAGTKSSLAYAYWRETGDMRARGTLKRCFNFQAATSHSYSVSIT